MRNLIRSLMPDFILKWYRSRKKKLRNTGLQSQKKQGIVLTKSDLLEQFNEIGINDGDSLLVHCSLSKIGFVENGAKDVVEALLLAVGSKGNLLMPNSPNASFQLEYIRTLGVFDVENTPSKLGAVSEYFRKLPKTIRSEHPTEPVSCAGPYADWFTKDHFGNETPYNVNSPFFKLYEKKGKILYLGVTLDNAGTNLHTLEDAIEDFKFQVYFPELFEVKVKNVNGEILTMNTKVHHPDQSKKRRCDELIPLFIERGVMKKVKIGKANSLIVDAKGMYDVMIQAYIENGITMYTPFGS
jgi:aminoglycoside 3-N-acetyltransferase